MNEFDVVGSSVKVSGEASLPFDTAYEHGDELYVVGKVAVKEVAFPRNKDGLILRIHRAKINEAFVVDAEGAEDLIAEQRETTTGQGNLVAEFKRSSQNK